MAKTANKTLKTSAPTTPQKIINFLFLGTKFAAIKPIMIALSAAKIISMKIICKSMSDSSNKVIFFKKTIIIVRFLLSITSN